MGLPASLAFMNSPLAVLLFALVFVPLTALWGYSLVRCLGKILQKSRVVTALTGPTDRAPLDDLTWALLIVLCGWFGALAYLAVEILPRLQGARRRLIFLQH